MSSVQRREFLAWLAGVCGGPIVAPLAAGILAGCRVPHEPAGPSDVDPGQAGPTGQILDADALALVAVLCEQIIPTTDTPGAAAAGVHLYVDEMLAAYFDADARARFSTGLEAIDAAARAAHGRPYLDCDAAQRHALLRAASEEPSPAGEASFFSTLKQLTVAGYYTSKVGMTEELRPNPMGRYEADLPYAEIGRSWA